MIVREQMLMRANFFFQEMRTFHNMRIGIVITACISINPSDQTFRRLTGYIGDHVEYTHIDQIFPRVFLWRWAYAFCYNCSAL